MSAIDDFAALVETTDVVRQLLKNMREAPARLLGDICQEYRATGQPVPEHRINLPGYIGEAALKALQALGLIKRKHGDWLSLFSYEPTTAGLEQYEKLVADGYYKK
ncbi:MAG: hypothetical protein HYX84_05165 [Chloroflexi bacterium]|nr:hypothetical protein [Chloroflexota bacterium]